MTSFASIVDIGEPAARGAADLLSDILTATNNTSAAQTGTETSSILDKVRGRGVTTRRDGAKTQALAEASRIRLSALSSFGMRLDALEKTLQADLFQLKEILEGQESVARTPDAVACRALTERRFAHLAGVEASLARCRILLQQLSRGEHLCSDALGLMRDVTVPMAVRQAGLTGLARAADTVRALGADSDKLCQEFLRRDAGRLAGKRPR
jgi:hypothetical protein